LAPAPAPARVRITGWRANPLRPGCVTETGTREREVTGVIADATCRQFQLILEGTIQSAGRLRPAATGGVRVVVSVKFPRGSAVRFARGVVSHGRWRVSLLVPGINLDPIPPAYLITVHYGGDHGTRSATGTRRVRIESESAGL
jgi:hypothetical protein